MTDNQLPAIIAPGTIATTSDTYIVPALIADLGEQASWRYVEFFTATSTTTTRAELMLALAPGFSRGAKIAALR
jgi:hypothetical protein